MPGRPKTSSSCATSASAAGTAPATTPPCCTGRTALCGSAPTVSARALPRPPPPLPPPAPAPAPAPGGRPGGREGGTPSEYRPAAERRRGTGAPGWIPRADPRADPSRRAPLSGTSLARPWRRRGTGAPEHRPPGRSAAEQRPGRVAALARRTAMASAGASRCGAGLYTGLGWSQQRPRGARGRYPSRDATAVRRLVHRRWRRPLPAGPARGRRRRRLRRAARRRAASRLAAAATATISAAAARRPPALGPTE
jgi:translation initiation factor IF-2